MHLRPIGVLESGSCAAVKLTRKLCRLKIVLTALPVSDIAVCGRVKLTLGPEHMNFAK